MARNLDAKCRQCRREGEKLFLKGEKCFTDKCSVERRAYAPASTAKSPGSACPVTVRNCAKSKRSVAFMAFLSGSSAKCSAMPNAKKGQTGENLLKLLEGRLDTVAYRMGFGVSRAEARQVVRHNGVLINGKRVDIPSYNVRPGDVIQLLDSTRSHLRTKAALEAAESRGFPVWLEVDVKAGKGVFKSYPAREDLPPSINEGLVVELYSR